MNYVWDILVDAKRKGIDDNSITFVEADICSPYMEIAFDDLNTSTLKENSVIEINPWYRFLEIFKDLININYTENKELRNVLFDILIHYLGKLDLNSGLYKKQFHRELLLRDIENNIFGNYLKENIQEFSSEELDLFLDGLINLYKCNTSLELFKRILKAVFKNNTVYINKDKAKDMYIYLGEKYSKELEKKINMILNTFLPINMNYLVFWNQHFGILGVDKTMKIDNIVMVK